MALTKIVIPLAFPILGYLRDQTMNLALDIAMREYPQERVNQVTKALPGRGQVSPGLISSSPSSYVRSRNIFIFHSKLIISFNLVEKEQFSPQLDLKMTSSKFGCHRHLSNVSFHVKLQLQTNLQHHHPRQTTSPTL